MVLNLFLYIHWLACLLNLVIWQNAPEFYKVQADGTYSNKAGELWVDSKGNPVIYNGNDF